MGLVDNWVAQPLRKAAKKVVLTREDREGQKVWCLLLGGLFRRVLVGSGVPGDPEFEAVRFALRSHPAQEISALTEAMHRAPEVTAEELIESCSGMDVTDGHELLRTALALGIGAGRQRENHDFLKQFAVGLGMEPEAFNDLEGRVAEEVAKRRKLLRSGAGIIVALVVIGIFILTATLLRSVIFGLIAAYIVLPLEKFYERRLTAPCGFLKHMYDVLAAFGAPFRKLAACLQRGGRNNTNEEKAARARQLVISRAVLLTVVTLTAVILAAVIGVCTISGRYVRQIQPHSAVRAMAFRTTAAMPADLNKSTHLPENVRSKVNAYLDKMLLHFKDKPLLHSVVSRTSQILNDPATQRELLKQVLSRTGGFFSFTANILGGVCGIIADILLTIFFFLLFLTKLAEFHAADKGAWQGEYLVRMVFNSAWLPGAGEGALQEAQRIISEVINRIQVWLKGYFTLVLVDSTVYTMVFGFLDVPYFFILGPLAGCGILLPYIGPFISWGVTLTVTLASGGSAVSAGMLLGISAAYLIYNGIIEQFILYPLVIGESLGLTALETIIVVLLGAIFAGIAGMILAIPAASVLKYLVPQIYHCFDRQPGGGAK